MQGRGYRGRWVALLTDLESNRLMSLVNAGVPYRDAGAQFGLTRRQVESHVYYRRHYYSEVGRARLRWCLEDTIAAQTLRKRGLSCSVIAQLLNRTKNSVAGHLWRMNGKRSKATG